jgi:hypothetical protein
MLENDDSYYFERNTTDYVGEYICLGGEKPPCQTVEGSSIIFARSMKAKKLLCQTCTIRPECLADGINELIGDGNKPNKSLIGFARAGVTIRELLDMAVVLHEAGVTRVAVSEARTILGDTI